MRIEWPSRGSPTPSARRRAAALGVSAAFLLWHAAPVAAPVVAAPPAKTYVEQVGSASTAIPVLLYHRIATHRNAVAPAAFEAQVRRLHEAGFSAITLGSYVRYIRGESVDLPRRPILITFDDAFSSSLTEADSVLARYGWSAAMYVATGLVGLPGRLTWQQLRLMQQSGRWQIDEHGGEGHVYVTVDAEGTRMPFYAAERWVGGKTETFGEYKRRVRHDIRRGASMLARHLPGWRSHGTFALPYGDYGQRTSNDPRIAAWLAGFLDARFALTFARASELQSALGLPFAERISVPSTWSAQMLHARVLREAGGLRAPGGARTRGG
jgi:peptidoglycan/xylan/chitin deacetylase (PgdA/CDA1 family)